VSRARTLSGDVPRLTAYREGLRPQLLRSPLFDGPRRARQIERLYRAIWRRHCTGSGP